MWGLVLLSIGVLLLIAGSYGFGRASAKSNSIGEVLIPLLLLVLGGMIYYLLFRELLEVFK